jgi:hypothetical protein
MTLPPVPTPSERQRSLVISTASAFAKQPASGAASHCLDLIEAIENEEQPSGKWCQGRNRNGIQMSDFVDLATP